MSHKFFIEPYITGGGAHVVRVDYGSCLLYNRWIATLSKEEALQLGQELIAAATTDFSQETEETSDK